MQEKTGSLKLKVWKKFRQLLYALLYISGVVSMWRYKNRHKIGVLTYHGIMDFNAPSKWRPLRHRMSVEHFERSLALLSRHYKFIDLDRAVSILAGHEPPVPNALVLTFDDGYKNNFIYALPAMEKLGIPAIFYIVTGHAEPSTPFWFDRIDYALQHAIDKPGSFDLHGKIVKGEKTSRDFLRKLYEDLRQSLKTKEYSEAAFRSEVNEIISSLENRAGTSLTSLKNDPWSAPADWSELRVAAKNQLVTIGSHSVYHTRLSFEEDEAVSKEVRESKKDIEANLGMRCNHFAFPNGAFDSRAKEKVRDAGYKSAVTTIPGFNSVGADLFELKRMYLRSSLNKHELLAKMSGLELAFLKIIRALKFR